MAAKADKAAIGFDRDAMLAAAKTVGAVVAGRNTIPILDNLLLRVADGRARLAGTDLDLLAETAVEAEGEGAVTLPAAGFRAALAGLREGAVTLAVEGARATLAQGRSRRTLPTLPPEDFPILQHEEGAAGFTIAGAALARLLGGVAHAVSVDETRYYLKGVYLHYRAAEDGPGALTAVATNGNILARARLADFEAAAGIPGLIVPTKAAQLLRAAAEGCDSVTIAMGENVIRAELGATVIVSKKIDGSYPEYARVIPAPREGRTATIAAGELARATKAAAAMLNEKTRAVKLCLRADAAEAARLEASDPSGVTVSEPVEEAGFAGEPLEVGINSRFLIETTGMFAASSPLTLDFADALAPILVTSAAEPDLTAVIMPMRI